MGVITHAHHRHVDASKERFRHAQRWACFETVFGQKFPRFVMTAAEAANYVFVVFRFYMRLKPVPLNSFAFTPFLPN